MKNIYLIAILSFCILSVNAQISEKFSYKYSKYGTISASPNFDPPKSQGRMGVIMFTDQLYYENKIYDEIRKVFTDEDFKRIQQAPTYIISISSSGSVLNCGFGFKPDDRDILTDNKLYQLYLNFKKITFDMSKTVVVESKDPNDTTYDYAEIVGKLLPPEYRKSPKVK